MSKFTRCIFLCDKCKKEYPSHAGDWNDVGPPPYWTAVGPHHLCPECLLRMQEEWLFQ